MLHPLCLDQVEAVVAEVELAKLKDAKGYKKKNCTKRLTAILTLAFDVIPNDPAGPAYRQGTTLGSAYTHWCRAKFFQQYRIYFRYDTASKVIIYAWVNDESTKRAYGSKFDAYTVSSRMLRKGHPPDNWADLKAECEAEDTRRPGTDKPSVADRITRVKSL